VVNTAGTFISTILTAAGCQNVITTNVSLYTVPSNETITAAICQGDSYELPNGNSVSGAGQYPVTLTTADGCTYLVTTILTVNPSPSSTVNINLTAGGPYTLPDGIVVSTSGTYVSVIQTALGCDNTITTNVTVGNPLSGCFAVAVWDYVQGPAKSG